MILALLLALLIGLSLGLLGSGGSIITLPVMVYVDVGLLVRIHGCQDGGAFAVFPSPR